MQCKMMAWKLCRVQLYCKCPSGLKIKGTSKRMRVESGYGITPEYGKREVSCAPQGAPALASP